MMVENQTPTLILPIFVDCSRTEGIVESNLGEAAISIQSGNRCRARGHLQGKLNVEFRRFTSRQSSRRVKKKRKEAPSTKEDEEEARSQSSSSFFAQGSINSLCKFAVATSTSNNHGRWREGK